MIHAVKTRRSKGPINPRYVVETITMTTVTERRLSTNQNIVIASTANTGANVTASAAAASVATIATAPSTVTHPTEKQPDGRGADNRSTYLSSDIGSKPISISAQITGILKGGKLWKHEQQQVIIILTRLFTFSNFQLLTKNHGN